jgi:hypothetical protein
MFSLIDAALQRVSLLHDWPWLEATENIATVAGTAEYTPNANWRTTLRLERDGHPDIEYRIPRDLAGYRQQNTGAPLLYTVERGKLIFAPVPDDVYTIQHVYIRTEPAVTTGTDVPLIPTWAENLVVVTAAHMLAATIKDGPLMKLLEPEMVDTYNALKDEVRRSRGFGKPKRRKDTGL